MNPLNPSFARDVADSFARQPIMKLLGAGLSLVEPGVVEIALPYRADLLQQDGYLHAGIISTIADSACGYAAYTLMPAGSNVLSVEFKVNLLRPAQGEAFVARAEIIKAGRTLTVVRADVFALTGGQSASGDNAGNNDSRGRPLSKCSPTVALPKKSFGHRRLTNSFGPIRSHSQPGFSQVNWAEVRQGNRLNGFLFSRQSRPPG